MHLALQLQQIRKALAHYAKQADAHPEQRAYYQQLWQEQIDKLRLTLRFK
jgi:hypothetical protein